jgi:hypothetical protein
MLRHVGGERCFYIRPHNIKLLTPADFSIRKQPLLLPGRCAGSNGFTGLGRRYEEIAYNKNGI